MENMQKTITEIFDEAFIVKGVSTKKLAEMTSIPERYLKAIYEGDVKNLPAVPYVRGYLVRIGEILEIDGQELWQAYQNKTQLRASGEADKLPTNRFAFRKANKKKWALAVIIAIVLVFLAYQATGFFGTPSIEISSPATESTIVNSSVIDLRGEINPQDSLTVNGEEISTDVNGRFEKQFSLEPGLNTIEFKVKRVLGKEVKITRQVIYQIQ